MPQTPATVTVDFERALGPMDIGAMALGQGGLSAEPMWDDRVAEVRALGPKLIRFWAQEYFAPKGVDSLVLRMNKDVPHSLLDCPGKYTVRVATFRGNVIIDQRKVEEIEKGGRMKSRLEQAAIDAHRLTEALREKGFEAYEFHDRHESFVTVGSFEWVGRPRADGKQEINPAVLRKIQQFSPIQQPLLDKSGRSVAGLQPRSLQGIPFDVQPWPVEVPKRSIADDYVRN